MIIFQDMGLFRRDERKKEIRYILSIDGGGIRGIIPGYILGMMNQIIRESGTDRPLYSCFDLAIGTSTGALLAFALTADPENTALSREEGKPFPAMKAETRGIIRRRTVYTEMGVLDRGTDPMTLEDLYISHRSEIFPQRNTVKSILYPLFQDKYSAEAIEGFLERMIGDKELSDTFIPTAAVSYSLDMGGVYLLRSWDSHGLLMKQALRATTAAPMYFPSAHIKEKDTGAEHTLADGGLAANNPALWGYMEARKLYPDADEFRILSLSTCKMQYSSQLSGAQGGLAAWAKEYTKIADDAQLCTADSMLEAIPGVKYTRIWAPVLTERIKLDATAEPSIGQLQKAAREAYSIEEGKIRGFISDMLEEEIHSSVRIRERKRLPEPSQAMLP